MVEARRAARQARRPLVAWLGDDQLVDVALADLSAEAVDQRADAAEEGLLSLRLERPVA
jgi:hypothetical protein